MMDLDYIWYDDRYRSNVLFSNTHNHACGQGHRLRTFTLNFCIKVFNSPYFPDHVIDLVYILYGR